MEDALNKFSGEISSSQSTHRDTFRNIVSQLTSLCGWFYSDEMRLSVESKESLDNTILDNDDYCRTLLSRYGGGYEIATLTQNGFAKLGNLTYLTWLTEKTDSNFLGLLPRAFYITYIDDILLIYVIDFDRELINFKNVEIIDDNTYKPYKISQIKPYVISPIYRELTDHEKCEAVRLTKDCFISSETFCNFIYPIEKDKLVGKPVSTPTYTSLELKRNFHYFKFNSQKSNELFLGISTTYIEYLSTFHNISPEI